MSTIILLALVLTYFPAQEAPSSAPIKGSMIQAPDRNPSECVQPTVERDSLIREAEKNQYTIRWIIFVGNEHTRDYVLRRRMINLVEGDVFTRENLVRSLDNVSKLKRPFTQLS